MNFALSCRMLSLVLLTAAGSGGVLAAATADDRQNTSYALGMQLADNVKSTLPQWPLDSKHFTDGAKDYLAGNKLRLSQADIVRQLQKVGNNRDKPPAGLNVPDFSYAMGVYSSGELLIDTEQLSIQHFLAGIRDMIDGIAPLLTNEQAQHYLEQYFAGLQRQREQETRLNLARNKKFFADNKSQPGVKVHKSGIQYQVLQPGDGPAPKQGSEVTVHYTGTLLDGTEFDSSRKGGKPVTFSLGQVIKGWQIMLPLMNTGALWRIWLPPELAYGEAGAPPNIGPHQALVFEIELVAIPGGGKR